MELAKNNIVTATNAKIFKSLLNQTDLGKISNLSFYIANIFTNYYSTPDKNQKLNSTHPPPQHIFKANDFKLCNWTQM